MKGKIQTTWNLGLLYSSMEDPRIEKDIQSIEKECISFEKKYKKDTTYTKDILSLKKAVQSLEKIESLFNPLVYFWLLKEIDSSNTVANAKMSLYEQRLTEASNRVVFFQLSLAKVSDAFKKKILIDKQLKGYTYFFTRIFNTAKYYLNENEEKIMSKKSLPSFSMWVDKQGAFLTAQTVAWKGKEITFSEASGLIPKLPLTEAEKLHMLFMKKLQLVSYFAEAEINAIVIDKKINDELRGYVKPYSSTIVGYGNEDETVESLIALVTKYFILSQRFYTLKAKLLKRKKLSYAHRASSIGTITKKFTFTDTVSIIESAFGKANPEYSEIFNGYLQSGQIDVFPRKNKTSGAFCFSSVKSPVYVLLNHTDDFKSLMTCAHEMGHAIHAEYSAKQPILYQGHSIATAEVASTLFENFAFQEVYESLSDKEKIIALHDRIQDDVSTIFRQIACFNFENELHTRIRKEGELSKEQIAELMNTHMSAYIGNAITFTKEDGYFFVSWGHIRLFFYVYSYAFGQLVSKALYAQYMKDKSFIKQIEHFLYAGNSKSPEDIFKDIGIDVRDPKFFEDGLKMIESDIIQLEKLTKK